MYSTPPMTVKYAFTLLRGGRERGGEREGERERGGVRERESERENSNGTEPQADKERCFMGMDTAGTRSIRQHQRSINKYTSNGVFQSCQADRSSCGWQPGRCGCDPSARGKIIAYASRALTDVERRYSQTDREMLAVDFGVEHFHLYLYGSNFTVYTDHEPLLGMYKSQKSATTRTERWRLRLTPYDVTLKYRPGRKDLNPADHDSRQPQDIRKRENAAEAYVNYVCKNALPKSMTLEEFAKRHRKTLR